jgi:hypothetical protein
MDRLFPVRKIRRCIRNRLTDLKVHGQIVFRQKVRIVAEN